MFFVLMMAGTWFASRWGLAGGARIGLQWLLVLDLFGTRWASFLRCLIPALWTGLWSTARCGSPLPKFEAQPCRHRPGAGHDRAAQKPLPSFGHYGAVPGAGEALLDGQTEVEMMRAVTFPRCGA